MADLNDLGYKSITDMTADEALEHLRQIRLSRRVPVKTTKGSSKKKVKKEVSAEQAAELIRLLTGGGK